MASTNRRGFIKVSGITILPVLIPLNTILAALPYEKKILVATKETGGNPFNDSTGSISFVNLASSFVTSNAAFTTGQEVCDKIASFFATKRSEVFDYLKANPTKVLPGDTVPVTQWDAPVINYMKHMLSDDKGFTAFQSINEIFSEIQAVEEFSTGMMKLIFDTTQLPATIVADATAFIQGIAKTLRSNWQDRSKPYKIHLIAVCHEAIPTDNPGNSFLYRPRIKYYTVTVDESQTAFTTPCENTKPVEFNFVYDYYVTTLKADLLDNNSPEYKDFISLLNNWQAVNYKSAQNNLQAILEASSF